MCMRIDLNISGKVPHFCIEQKVYHSKNIYIIMGQEERSKIKEKQATKLIV